jgi:hypothetical protein
MAKRPGTPSFTAEFPLRTTKRDDRELSVRLDAARQIYNASLGESLRRLDLMRQSKDWQRARATSKGKERSAIFKAAVDRFGFKAWDIQKFAENCRDSCLIGSHLGSHDTQTTSLRAFRAAEQYVFGKRGRPRFKGRRGLRSVEGKGDAVIYFRKEPVPAVHWAGLVLPLMLDPRDTDEWQAGALAARTKYCRILRREVRGRDRWHVQLVQEGLPPRKERHPVGTGIVGLDLGPSMVAAVSGDDAILEPFCPTLKERDREIRRVRRAMDRSRRATNPRNYERNGVIKKGAKKWTKSGRYRILSGMVSDIERRLAAERKRSHGELGNRVLSQGNVFKLEKLSYRAFQRMFGRSVRRHAPGGFVSSLRRKAESAGALVDEFGTAGTRLSQFDHKSGTYAKKPLRQRWHVFADGSRVQRDLYSAWLARHVENGRLDTSRLQDDWGGAEPLLRRTVSGEVQSASGQGFPMSRGREPVGADRPSKGGMRLREAADA